MQLFLLTRVPTTLSYRLEVRICFEKRGEYRDGRGHDCQGSKCTYLDQTIGYRGLIWPRDDEMVIGGFVMRTILVLVPPASLLCLDWGRLLGFFHAGHL